MWSSCKLSLAANFYILAHRFQFVKNFFQVFSNFFSIRYLSCRSRDSFDIISLHTRFVNTFFKGNYFYFEILFLWPALGRFPPVPAVSWPLCPGCYPFIHALRRGALYLWRCRIRSWDAGNDTWSFMEYRLCTVQVMDPGWIFSWCSWSVIWYGFDMRMFPFPAPVNIHTLVCILMHWGLDFE